MLCNSDILLRYYGPELELFLETDASGVAIGMALLQNESNEREDSMYPIAYSSKTLTDAETRYANIECELLGVVGGLKKFHYFMFGRPVTVLTDHKPLIALTNKLLVIAHPRLQRLSLRMKNYNVELNWIPGKEMIFNDHLSRNINTEKTNVPTCKGLDLKIHARSEKCASLTAETSKDETFVALKNQIIKGWLPMRSECLKSLQDYWNYRDELSILDGLVLKETCIVIPNQCREELLNQLHQGHFRIDRTKLKARDSVYWPGIIKDIEIQNKTCNTCQEMPGELIKIQVYQGKSLCPHGQHLRWTYSCWTVTLSC